MSIEFYWDSGQISVNPHVLIQDMPMSNYKKWAALFARYGKKNDHVEFLQLLEDEMTTIKKDIEPLEAERDEFIAKGEGRIRTELTPAFCMREAQRIQRQINGKERKLKRYQTMSGLLKGLI